ncbi:hypothetical protein ACOME3_001867 [Neoechinorhynchus agilis]
MKKGKDLGTTGIDVGHHGTFVSPVEDGHVYLKGVVRSPFGGEFIATEITKLVKEDNLTPIQLIDKIKRKYTHILNFGNDIIRSVCRVREDTDYTNQPNDSHVPASSYEFPNGNQRDFTNDILNLTESFFSLKSDQCLSKLVTQCLTKCDVDIRQSVCKNIVCIGGCSQMNGFCVRLENELNKNVSANYRIDFVSIPRKEDRRNAAFKGGAFLASWGKSNERWLTKEIYEDEGRRAVHRFV